MYMRIGYKHDYRIIYFSIVFTIHFDFLYFETSLLAMALR